MLRSQLHSIRRGNSTIFEFLQHIKSISDSLAEIGESVPDSDLVMYVLSGLGRDYSRFVITMQNREIPLSFSELRCRLVTHEQWIKDQDDDSNSFFAKDPITYAFYVKKHHSYDSSSKKPVNGSYSPKFSQGASSSNFTYKKGEFNPTINQEQDYNSIPCQIWNQLGHFASRYRYRYAAVGIPPSRSPTRRSSP